MLKVPIVCDTGTGVIKAGFAGEKEPSVMFPNLVGRPMLRYDIGLDAGLTVTDLMVGDDANNARAMLQLNRPIADGKVTDWNDMEAVWEHTWDRLGIVPSEHQVVQTEAAMNPPANRQRIVETMFEKYGFAGVNVSVQAVMALNSQGLESGFVVDSGDGVTHLVPVTHGFVEPALVERVNLAGRHVTDHFMKLLRGAGHPLNPKADFETVREMKQKLCYVAYDPEAEKKLARETTVVDRNYTLPDSRTMRVGAERFMAPELLFTPGEQGNGIGIADLVFKTIRKSELDVQKGYFANIVLSGGTTMFPGFSSRLERDIRKLYLDKVLQGDKSRANKFKCQVEDPPRRQHMVFLGASIMANAHAADTNSRFFISRQEYNERGVVAINERCCTMLR
mmetsp:Transcript_35328/g.100359  ORF Transcript_35328/g.100359 Transcript_35328/m.100359 type:complete len:393 (+) Transcript_35328:153-1331(+)